MMFRGPDYSTAFCDVSCLSIWTISFKFSSICSGRLDFSLSCVI